MGSTTLQPNETGVEQSGGEINGAQARFGAGGGGGLAVQTAGRLPRFLLPAGGRSLLDPTDTRRESWEDG